MSVDKLSIKYSLEGEIFAIKEVLEFPPREFFNKNVNFESQYQICLSCPLLIFARELITYPNTVKLLLI